MSEKKLNVAVIGCGVIADFHLKGVLANPHCALYAVCDNATDDRLERRRKEYDPVIAVADYHDLVNDPKVDMAIITTPDNTHCEMTCAFLRAGVPVLLEKPMALTNEDCAEMRRVEKETGTRLMVGQVGRYNPPRARAKQLVEDGAIGELVFVECEYAHSYRRARGYNDWRVSPDREGMIGGGCHAVDFLRWVAGNPTEVTAYSNHKYLTDWPVDDTTIAIYKFPNNVIGKIFCSIGVKRDKANRVCLYGTEGTIIIEGHSNEIKMYQVDKNGNNFTAPKIVPVQNVGHNMKAEISDFVNAILEDAPNPISSIEGASTVAVCRATVDSAKLGKPVQIVYPKD